MPPKAKIEKYRFLGTLGHGSFSKVKLAQDLSTGMKYAIKMVDLKATRAEKLENQLHREIQVMSSLVHPGLIQLHEVIRDSTHLFLVLEFASGGELFAKLTEDAVFAEPVARSYFQQLIDALSYMHSCGAVHRDLKPENLLLGAAGRLKIADFGMSVFVGEDQLRTKCGTPSYVAPEVFSGQSYTGEPVDVWSAGVILYEMLTGEVPFVAPSINQLLRMIQRADVRYPEAMPRGAVDLLSQIFVADPGKRITMDGIQHHPWFTVDYHAEPESADAEPVNAMDAFELIAALAPLTGTKLAPEKPGTEGQTLTIPGSTADVTAAVWTVLGVKKSDTHPSEDGTSYKPSVQVGSRQVQIRITVRAITAASSLLSLSRLKGQQRDFAKVFQMLKQLGTC
jgi:serine/threonine protein kinase